MKTKHTEGKIKVDKRVGCIALYEESKDHNCLANQDNYVAYWHGYSDETGWNVKDIDLANAKRIVKCWNMHDELLKACEFVLNELKYNRVHDGLKYCLETVIKKATE